MNDIVFLLQTVFHNDEDRASRQVITPWYQIWILNSMQHVEKIGTHITYVFFMLKRVWFVVIKVYMDIL